MRVELTPENYDGVVGALIGNGELCTTVGPTGYHTPPEQWIDTAHRTQQFVWAGRRRSGPQHPLVNFGTITRTLLIDGQPAEARSWRQRTVYEEGAVRTFALYGVRPLAEDGVAQWEESETTPPVTCLPDEHTTTGITLDENLFYVRTVWINRDSVAHEIEWTTEYRFGEEDVDIAASEEPEGVHLSYRLEDHLGDIWFHADSAFIEPYHDQTHPVPIVNARLAGMIDHGLMHLVPIACRLSSLPHGAQAVVRMQIPAGRLGIGFTWLHFSDREHYAFPPTPDRVAAALERSAGAWKGFWNRSQVVTGDRTVDAFRKKALYTLRCQATPWSIPPTLSKPYWDGGAFHDEMYPFLGLLSSNYPELAERIPYFRLTTLPQAQARARGRGALYPWSSTEEGEERDPNGLWLTERFHLGQFSASIQYLWLYERNEIQLDDLYPVLRDVARYFELNMLERDEMGRLGTRACVDFDESVGAVVNGPFTISAAIASLEYAAQAAETLGRDVARRAVWRALAQELRHNLPSDAETYIIPEGKPLHYAILGPIFPFRVDVDSPLARNSAAYIHRVCRSNRGWKPGFSEVFERSNWMWMAGHLGIVHALQGEADLAWEAVQGGPASAGPLLSPNEHVDCDGIVRVPWFTTGCGGWLYALYALFVQVDEMGTRLLPAVPSVLPNVRFRDLRAEYGALVSGELREGRLVHLSVRAPKSKPWRFRIPSRYIAETGTAGHIVDRDGEWVAVEIDLVGDAPTSLLSVDASQG